MAPTEIDRARTYAWLARLFDGDVRDLLDTARRAGTLGAPVERVRALLTSLPIDDVLADHTRLFVNAPGGVAAPPYASWYLDRCLHGPTTERVRAKYAAQGLEIDGDAGEPPDYISTELEFMLFLTRHELAARETGDGLALRAVLDAESDFIRHLSHWIPSFVACIRSSRPGDLFGAAADALESALNTEIERLPPALSKSTATAAPR